MAYELLKVFNLSNIDNDLWDWCIEHFEMDNDTLIRYTPFRKNRWMTNRSKYEAIDAFILEQDPSIRQDGTETVLLEVGW